MTARECCVDSESFSGGCEMVPDGQASVVHEHFGQFCHQLFAVLRRVSVINTGHTGRITLTDLQ